MDMDALDARLQRIEAKLDALIEVLIDADSADEAAELVVSLDGFACGGARDATKGL